MGLKGLKKHGEKIDIPSLRIYINKIENRITIKTGLSEALNS